METMKLVFITICIVCILLFSFLTIGVSTLTLRMWNDLQKELTRIRDKK